MPHHVDIKSSALRELADLTTRDRQRVDAAILMLADEPRPRGCRKMAGAGDFFRIRVGRFRVVYEVDDARLVVPVGKVGPRREVYRRR